MTSSWFLIHAELRCTVNHTSDCLSLRFSWCYSPQHCRTKISRVEILHTYFGCVTEYPLETVHTHRQTFFQFWYVSTKLHGLWCQRQNSSQATAMITPNAWFSNTSHLTLRTILPFSYSTFSVYITCIFHCLFYVNRIIEYCSRHEFAIVASLLVQMWIPHTWTEHSTEQYYRLLGRNCTLVILTALLSALFCPPYSNYLHASRAEWDTIHIDTHTQTHTHTNTNTHKHKQTKWYADTSCCIEEAQD